VEGSEEVDVDGWLWAGWCHGVAQTILHSVELGISFS
jgi:hypothetical protein